MQWSSATSFAALSPDPDLHSSMVDLGWAPDHLHTVHVTLLYCTWTRRASCFPARICSAISCGIRPVWLALQHPGPCSSPFKNNCQRTSGVWWLRLHFRCRGTDLIPGWGAKVSNFHLAQPKINKIKLKIIIKKRIVVSHWPGPESE